MSSLFIHNEPDLLTKFKKGNPKAFDAIYNAYHFRIYLYTRKILMDESEAEDVTADTFVKLWDKKESFSSLENIVAFLKVAARNACLDRLKHKQVISEKQSDLIRVLETESNSYFASLDILDELMRLVYEEVEKMPKKMREIFLLSYKEGLKPAEIAEKLGLSVQTVSNQKTNAVKLLKMVLSNKTFIALMPFMIDNHQILREVLSFIYGNMKKS